MRRRMLAAKVSGVVVVALACFPVCAQIYKCPEGNGFSLQQSPCAGLGQSGGRLLVLPNGRRRRWRWRPAPAASASDVPKARSCAGPHTLALVGGGREAELNVKCAHS